MLLFHCCASINICTYIGWYNSTTAHPKVEITWMQNSNASGRLGAWLYLSCTQSIFLSMGNKSELIYWRWLKHLEKYINVPSTHSSKHRVELYLKKKKIPWTSILGTWWPLVLSCRNDVAVPCMKGILSTFLYSQASAPIHFQFIMFF